MLTHTNRARHLRVLVLFVAALATGCGRTTSSGPVDFSETLDGLRPDAVVLQMRTFLGLPRPDDPPSLRLEVTADGSVQVWDREAGRYGRVQFSRQRTVELMAELWEAGGGLEEWYADLDTFDCGGGQITFVGPAGETRQVSWDCGAPDDARAALAVVSAAATEALQAAEPVPVDATALRSLDDDVVILAIETRAESCVGPRLVLTAGGRVTVSHRHEIAVGTWNIGRDRAITTAIGIIDAARRAAQTPGADRSVIVHGVVGHTTEGRQTEQLEAASADLVQLMQELEEAPPEVTFSPPEQLVLQTAPSVDDPRSVDPSAPPLAELAEFAIVPSNRGPWSRIIEGDLIDEFIAAAIRGRTGLPDQAWIAVPGYRTGTDQPVTASLTCYRPVIDGLSMEWGIAGG